MKVSVDIMKKKAITSTALGFLKENVLSVTDLTRTNKLSEILNKFAGEETSEIYIIQNNKNRNAVGVLVDLEYYERLLKVKEAVEEAVDENIYQIALQRINEKANIPLTQVVDDNDFELNELVKAASDVQLDEE